MKNKLLTQSKEDGYLVILPYYQDRAQGDEIRIALKSWRKFCKSKYKFVVIGQFNNDIEQEFDWVKFIPTKRVNVSNLQYIPHLDVQYKMEVVYNLFHDKYKGFIYTADDSYAIKSFSIEELKVIHFHSISFMGNEKAPTSFWVHDKWKTRQLLDKENLLHINYTTHFPRYYEFDRLHDLWDKYNMRKESYVLEDIYFNSYIHEHPTLDSTIRLGIWNKDIYEREFDNAINNPNIKFICNSVEGWSKELEESLKKVVGMTDENSTDSRNG